MEAASRDYPSGRVRVKRRQRKRGMWARESSFCFRRTGKNLYADGKMSTSIPSFKDECTELACEPSAENAETDRLS